MNKKLLASRLFGSLIVIVGIALFNVNFVFADETHHMGHPERDHPNEMKDHADHEGSQMAPQMDHSSHDLGDLPKNFEKPVKGVKELKINLKGPFCQKHPEEIRGALMQLEGVKAVEAFNGRKYVVIQYTGDETTPEQMSVTVSGLKGSGWRCQAELALH